MKVKVSVNAELPKELVKSFVQYIRDFDTKHDPKKYSDVHFLILMTGDITQAEAEEIMRSINPPFDMYFNGKKPS